MDISCFTSAVGLARCACPCLEDEAPEGFNDSDSGLFLADLAPFDALEGLDDCNTPGNPWEMLSNAREQGIIKFLNDINVKMHAHYRATRKPFQDGIGEAYARETVAPPGGYAGMRIRCAPIPHATLTIEKIGGIFEGVGSVSFNVYDRFNNLVSGPHSITSVAGKLTETTALSVSLPMYTPFADAQEYFIAYQVDDDNLPRNNKVHCGCGGTPKFTLDPSFNSSSPRYAWANWVKVGGWSGDTLTDFDQAAEETSAVSNLYGLTVRVRITCDAVKILCPGESLDFSQPLSAATAHAIRYAAADYLAAKILSDTSLSRFSLINREALAIERQQWAKQYDAQLAFINENANVTAGGCLTCKPGIGIRSNPVLT